MKHLLDAREAITTADIDRAQADARAWLSAPVAFNSAFDLIERLLAIVTDAYGPPPAPVHLMTAGLDLACGHDGQDPSSSVAAEVTCPACVGALI